MGTVIISESIEEGVRHVMEWLEEGDLFDCPPLIRRQCMTGNDRHKTCTHEIQGTVQDCPIYQQKSS